MKKLIYILLFMAVIVSACESEKDEPKPDNRVRKDHQRK